MFQRFKIPKLILQSENHEIAMHLLHAPCICSSRDHLGAAAFKNSIQPLSPFALTRCTMTTSGDPAVASAEAFVLTPEEAHNMLAHPSLPSTSTEEYTCKGLE